MIDMGTYRLDYDGDIRHVDRLEWVVVLSTYYVRGKAHNEMVWHGPAMTDSQLKIFSMYHKGI